MVVARWLPKSLILVNFALVSLPICAMSFENAPHTAMTWHGEDISDLIAGDAALGYSKYEHQGGSFGITTAWRLLFAEQA